MDQSAADFVTRMKSDRRCNYACFRENGAFKEPSQLDIDRECYNPNYTFIS